MALSDLVPTASPLRLRGHYYRSVHLQRDAAPSQLSHYQLTPMVRSLSERIYDALCTPNSSRAWSLTGPYGTGKSAFAVFLSQWLSGAFTTLTLPQPSQRLLPVLLIGQRRDLNSALLEQLLVSLESHLPDFVSQWRDVHPHTPAQIPSDSQVLEAYETALQRVKEAGFAGLLLIVDEFGKFLEHSARHGHDVFIMQSLAELTSRSLEPFALLTVLHSAFSNYLGDLADEHRRSEWRKVQGRFEDVAFQEPPEQVLRLVGDALLPQFSSELQQRYEEKVQGALEHPALQEAAKRLPLAELLPACVPLEPVTALLLVPLFRSKMAQNERSLFAFLASHEPHGLQHVLQGFDAAAWSQAPLYSLPQLYDYVHNSLGLGVYQGEAQRRWLELSDALDRLDAHAPAAAAALVKSIGLLWLYGRAVGLAASEACLGLALQDSVDAAQLEQSLRYLEARSIIVYRRFEQAYALWQGSDIDVQQHYHSARASLRQLSLAHSLQRHIALRPIVARRHYIRTGTLRYFSLQLLDAEPEALQAALEQAFPLGAEDGRILFLLSADEKNRQALQQQATALLREHPEAQRYLLAFPLPLSGLREQLEQLEAWRYVWHNTAGLAHDRVARREVQHHLQHAQQQLETTAGAVLGLRGQRFTPQASAWWHAGERREFHDAVAFQRYISEICDQLFHSAPPLHNELLNREKHSSSAKAALNKLVKAMLKQPKQERFGIPGTPPEVSMYEAFFRQSKSHDSKKGSSHYRLQAPKHKNWKKVWQAIEDFLQESQQQRLPVTELYKRLRRPPYGLRAGVLPLFLYTALQVHAESVALYRDGLYEPVLSEELSELLSHVPEHFALQRFALNADNRRTLEALRDALQAANIPTQASRNSNSLLMALSRPLVINIFQLNAYSKHTRQLSEAALALRSTLLAATDPHALLLQDIPALLGHSQPHSRQDYAALSQSLYEALQELLSVYPRLLDSLEQQLAEVFTLSDADPAARLQTLRARARPLQGYAHRPPLSLFVRELARLEPGKQDWREALGRVLLDGLPPSNWRDRHVLEFQVNLSAMHHEFVRLSELVQAKEQQSAERIVRLDILADEHSSWRGSIPLQAQEQQQVKDLAAHLKDVIVRFGKPTAPHVNLAALVQMLQEQLEKGSNDDDPDPS